MSRDRTRRHRHRHRPKRSITEWGIRLLLAAGAGLLGYGAIIHAMAAAFTTRHPRDAYLLAPDDGRIAAVLSEKAFDSGQSDTGTSDSTQLAPSATLARWALLHDPTAVAAATSLGLYTLSQHNPQRAKQWLDYAQSLSRRNFRTQLWAIEDAVGRDNIIDTLHDYDIALRTTSRAPDLLYPILSSAIADPSIRAELVKTFDQKSQPEWGDSFLHYAAASGPDMSATAALFQALQQAGLPVEDRSSALIINRLIADGRVDDAWSYYASIHPGADQRRTRDPHFDAGPDHPSLFDWVPVNAAGINSVLQKDNGSGAFYFSAPSSIGGVALQQMQMLPPGNYTLQGRSIGIDQPADSHPYWIMKCTDDKATEIGRLYLPNSSDNHGQFSGNFQVPQDCPYQSLMLMLRSSDAVAGVSGRIVQLILQPAGT
jgi:hypothetical protein